MTSTIAKILDGKWLAKVVTASIAAEVKELSPKVGRPPGLAVILVGENPGSITYVSNKERTAKECGFNTFNIRLTSKATSNDVKKVIKAFNKNKEVDGILLQLPLPEHLRPNPLLDLIDPEKDLASIIDRSPGPRLRSRLSINHRHRSPSRRYSSFLSGAGAGYTCYLL